LGDTEQQISDISKKININDTLLSYRLSIEFERLQFDIPTYIFYASIAGSILAVSAQRSFGQISMKKAKIEILDS
jgi:hypothetical protein